MLWNDDDDHTNYLGTSSGPVQLEKSCIREPCFHTWQLYLIILRKSSTLGSFLMFIFYHIQQTNLSPFTPQSVSEIQIEWGESHDRHMFKYLFILCGQQLNKQSKLPTRPQLSGVGMGEYCTTAKMWLDDIRSLMDVLKAIFISTYSHGTDSIEPNCKSAL